MTIHEYTSHIYIPNAIATTGFFDGVHLGHRSIIEELRQFADEMEGESVVVTFWPHPRWVTQSQEGLKLLNTLEEKQDLLSGTGLDHLVVVPFDKAFASLTAEQYLDDFLIGRLGIRGFVTGYNHRFGKGRAGDYALLQKYAARHKFGLRQLSAVVCDNENISSTLVRESLLSGRVDVANRHLGYHYMLSGTIVSGKQLGRTIGYPTANIQPDEPYKLIPQDGVYAVFVVLDGKRYRGMMNIGHNPTVESTPHKSIEVHLFDFEQAVYGQTLRVEFVHYLRPEYRYDTMDALKEQMDQDKRESLSLLSQA